MATTKRQRQKEGRLARLEAARAAQKRAQTRRRIITGVVVVVVFVLVAFLFSAMFDNGDDGQAVDAGDTTTTAAPTTTAPPTFGSTECPPADGSAERTIDFDAGFQDCLDPDTSYTAVFDTSEGRVEVGLDTENTPGTVNNFVALSRYHYYDGTKIFRTDTSIDIIQGGSPHTEDNSDPGPGYDIPDEGSGFTYSPGDLVMARGSAPNSASAQYFFVVGPNGSNLDAQGTYVTFGHVTDGLGVLEAILALNQDDPASGLGGAPSRDVIVQSVTIVEGDASTSTTGSG